MTDWAKRDNVQKAWKELVEEHGLSQKELTDIDRVFGFLDGRYPSGLKDSPRYRLRLNVRD